MALYTVVCEDCQNEFEVNIKITSCPKVGEPFVAEESHACICGCRRIKRIMERTPSSFRLNFRRSGI